MSFKFYRPAYRIIALTTAVLYLWTMGAANADFVLTLENGDVDRDNILTIGDAGLVLLHENAELGDPGWDPICDVDGDDMISIGDAGIILWNENMEGDTDYPTGGEAENGSITLRGRVDLEAWYGPERTNIEVKARRVGDTAVYTKTVTDGMPFTLLVPQAGEYDVWAKYPGWLIRKTDTPVTPSSVLHVSTTGNDSNDGLVWGAAKRTVQAAIDAASAGDEIWVAAGTYAERITLKEGVRLYGGFAGTEISRYQRDWTANVTILDGNQTGSVVTAPRALPRRQ